MDILDIFLDILLKPPQPLMGLFSKFIKLQYSAAASQLNYSLAHYHTALASVYNCKL